MAQADAARDAGDRDRAARLYGEVPANTPLHQPALVQRGNMLKDVGRLDAARSCYFAALALREDADIHLQLGHLFKLRGQWEDARHHYGVACDLDNDLSQAKIELEAVIARLETPSTPQPSTRDGAKDRADEVLDEAEAGEEEVYRLVSGHLDVQFYRRSNPDVAKAEANGGLDPVRHFIKAGWREGRDPTSTFSISSYLGKHPELRLQDVNPFYHYLMCGGAAKGGSPGSAGAFGRETDDSGWWADYTRLKRAESLGRQAGAANPSALGFCVNLAGSDLVSIARELAFDASGPIEVSVIIPCLEQGLYTLEAITSVARSTGRTIEVVIVDNGSKEAVYEAIAQIHGLTYRRLSENAGFGPACNIGAEAARGRYLLFLNNDAQTAPEAIDAMVSTLEANPRVAIVGPKVLSFDGRLQEAGCLLRRDGTTQLVGYGADQATPRLNYARDVEYISGVALCISAEDFRTFGGFDDLFAPAYCEDADLCLKVRQSGRAVRYQPSATVAHHLSRTTLAQGGGQAAKMKMIVQNQQKLAGRWQERLATDDLKVIAFYLPQYHPIPENDRWWGAGFTEWTNTTKALPNYDGHRQPRRPADLGYYDLRSAEVMEAQANLAARYGVSGFCYYYYWFDGKRLLDGPLSRMMKTGRPDFPFCLCWANENWTGRWDGGSRDVLIAQTYSEESNLDFIRDIAPYLAMPNHIRVDGKPLLLVYRVKEFPNFRRTVEVWRNYCVTAGIGEIAVAMMETFELSPNPVDPARYGCDFAVEFPPHQMAPDADLPVRNRRRGFNGAVRDYRELALNYMAREEPGFRRFRSVLVGWDNTPRRQYDSFVLERTSPGAFQAWLEWTLQRTREQNLDDGRLVFVNAWNEWCEGAYLEPDADFGHAYLQAVRSALDNVARG